MTQRADPKYRETTEAIRAFVVDGVGTRNYIALRNAALECPVGATGRGGYHHLGILVRDEVGIASFCHATVRFARDDEADMCRIDDRIGIVCGDIRYQVNE